jgi:hypothetical protein
MGPHQRTQMGRLVRTSSDVCVPGLIRLGRVGGLNALIRSYCGDDCCLHETGISVTRPGGGGLEWHTDGREGARPTT